jgi:thioredoxin
MAAKVSFDTPIVSNDQSFDRVLNAGLPVAALFWSGAKLDSSLEPELNALARAEAGKLLAVKIKRDENPTLVRRYNVRTTPTLVTFRDGKELTRTENVTPTQLREHVAYLLGRGPQPTPTPNPSSPPLRSEDLPPVQQSTTTYGQGRGDGKPVVVTDATFAREVMQSSAPVVVDFWAPWCGPCRMVAPALERIAAEYAGKLRVAKLNVDENPQTAMQYQVQGIPTMLFVKNGRAVDRVVGALPEPRIREQVERLLRA